MSTGANVPSFVRAMPVLDCTNMTRSLAFYRDKLGFAAATWGEPPSFAILQRGTVTLALALVEEGRAAVSRNWAAYLYVKDVDCLHAELLAHGVAVAHPPATKPYNCREINVDDPDGHVIGIGTVIEPDPLGPGLRAQLGRNGGAS